MCHTYSYLRVSTDMQTVENQRKSLKDAGFSIDKEFCDEGVSGGIAANERKGFAELMKTIQPCDQIVCTMVDRLGRNAADILKTIEEFKRLNVKVRILQFDGIDVTSSMGKMVITVMAALAEMEKAILIERTISGIARTKAQGTVLGPPCKLTPKVVANMFELYGTGQSLGSIATLLSIPKTTVARYLKEFDNAEEYTLEYYKAKKQYRASKQKKDNKIQLDKNYVMA